MPELGSLHVQRKRDFNQEFGQVKPVSSGQVIQKDCNIGSRVEGSNGDVDHDQTSTESTFQENMEFLQQFAY